jgi:hypothetical protein
MDETGPDQSGHADESGDGALDHLRLAEINHAEYDALADLFLGDGGYAPSPIESVDAPAAPVDGKPIPTHTTHTPVLQLTRHQDDADLGGMHEIGSSQGESVGMCILETLDTTDARASALLEELLADEPQGDGERDEGIDFVEMPRARVEVVVLGHLPVRATLWARQYACARAQECNETVALIRAASGSTALDLICDGEPIEVKGSVHLEPALDCVSANADRVILRVDEASEPELLDRPEVEEITILTGADEAAVVASYRLIKALDASLNEHYELGEGPSLRLAVMGASAEQSQDACTKLRNAVETFIERPIEIAAGSGRIDAATTTNIYRDSIAHPASHIIDGLVRAARKIPLVGIEKPEMTAETERKGEEDDAAMEPLRVEFPAGGVNAPEPRRETIPETPEPDRVEGSVQGSARGSTDDSRDDAPTMRDGLCAMIPGLEPIEARCPKAPGVELALDGQGQLHLIVSDADTQDAMNRLLAAQSWARNNLSLLIRAEPSLAMPSTDRNDETDPTMHLIAIDPRTVREIFDTSVRIYALARVKVGKIIAQVATPIN